MFLPNTFFISKFPSAVWFLSSVSGASTILQARTGPAMCTLDYVIVPNGVDKPAAAFPPQAVTGDGVDREGARGPKTWVAHFQCLIPRIWHFQGGDWMSTFEEFINVWHIPKAAQLLHWYAHLVVGSTDSINWKPLFVPSCHPIVWQPWPEGREDENAATYNSQFAPSKLCYTHCCVLLSIPLFVVPDRSLSVLSLWQPWQVLRPLLLCRGCRHCCQHRLQ